MGMNPSKIGKDKPVTEIQADQMSDIVLERDIRDGDSLAIRGIEGKITMNLVICHCGNG